MHSTAPTSGYPQQLRGERDRSTQVPDNPQSESSLEKKAPADGDADAHMGKLGRESWTRGSIAITVTIVFHRDESVPRRTSNDGSLAQAPSCSCDVPPETIILCDTCIIQDPGDQDSGSPAE